MHILVHHVRGLVTNHSLVVWLLCLIFVVLGGVWLSGFQTPILAQRDESRKKEIGNWLRSWSIQDKISGIFFVFFLAVYIYGIFYKEDFAYYDDDMLTDFSLQGKPFPPPVWGGLGRFYPLADQEFNLLDHITRSSIGYHLLVVVELVVLICLMFLVLRKLAVKYRFLTIAATMLAPSFLTPFMGFVYPERNVLFWLVVLLLCAQNYRTGRSRFYFVGCLIATQFVLYYKETVILFVVGYALASLFVEYWGIRKNRGWSWLEFAKQNSLFLAMLVVSSIYAFLFVLVLVPHDSFSYVAERRQDLLTIFSAYLRINWAPLLLFLVFIWRAWRFVFDNGEVDSVWDPVAVGALAYGAGIIGVRLYSAYYMAPVDFLAVLYLFRMVAAQIPKLSAPRKYVFGLVCLCFMAQVSAFSVARFVERKGIIATKEDLAVFLASYLPSSKSKVVDLYFPYATNYHMMDLASFLRYKGFRLVGQKDAAQSSLPAIVIEAPGRFEHDLCVDYRDYACIHEDHAKPGDLIVILPDDHVSAQDVRQLRQNADDLFSTRVDRPLTRPGSWFRSLHAITTTSPQTKLPDHWLKIDVLREHA